MDEKIKRFEKEKKTTAEENKRSTFEIRSLYDELSASRGRLMELEETIEDLASENDQLKRMIDEYKSKVESLSQEKNLIEARLKEDDSKPEA